VLFDKNKETLLYYPPNKEGKSYTVPEGVTTIKKYAFQSKNLKEILLPNSLKIIEERAFYFTNLKELSIPDTINLSASSLNGLPNSTISVKFSGNIKRIENSTLKREEKITKVGLAEGLEEIGEAAFDMTSMNVVAIPKSVKKIEKGAFRRSSLDFVIYIGTKKDFYNLIQEAGFDDRPNRKMPELVKEVNLVIDGMPIDFDGLAERPFYYKNKVYVPSQYICNLCGISTKWISWNPETAQYQKDDIVVCKPGEKIAVDGTVIEGSTHIDESFITGESVPVKRESGSKVIAGSINYEGTIKYKAEKIGKESTVSEIVRLVVESTSSKAPIAKIADKVSSIFVPVVIAIAIVAFIVWMIISKDIAFAINIFITVLVVACPCGLGLATPLAIIVGSGLATKKGILVKSSESLENAHKVKTVVFDKTGTLTEGKLTVSKLYNYSDLKEEEVLKIIASVENKSEHPIARAIVNYVAERKIDIVEVNDFKAIAGMGVEASYNDNKTVIIGNQKLMDENKIEILEKQDAESLMQDENSILYVALDNKLIALVGVKDTIRKDIAELIEKLKEKNINVVMLTGDNEKTAQNIAEKLKIDKVISNVMPKQKAEEIEKLKQNGLVMMCGDGINDSISLVKADIGVSVSSGTDIARDSAQVVIMNDNLKRINDVIEISKKTVRNIKQNLFWAFFYNICMIPIAIGLLKPIGISMNPMVASLAMTLSSLTVVFNSLRIKQ